MSINLYPEVLSGASKALYIKTKSRLVDSTNLPYQEHWIKSQLGILNKNGKQVKGATEHSKITLHDFIETYKAILTIIQEREIKIGFNFKDSNKDFSYALKNINFNRATMEEIMNCLDLTIEQLRSRESGHN